MPLLLLKFDLRYKMSFIIGIGPKIGNHIKEFLTTGY